MWRKPQIEQPSGALSLVLYFPPTVSSEAKAKKRKLSDLTASDATSVLSSLETLLTSLDEDDEIGGGQLEGLYSRFQVLNLRFQNTSFSKADVFTVIAANIQSGPLFLPSLDKRGEIEALGSADVANSALSFNVTVELTKLVRNHVSTVVSRCQMPIYINISFVLIPRLRSDAAY
jgi:hypothetical protein